MSIHDDFTYSIDPENILVNETSFEGPVTATLGSFDEYMKTVVVLGIIFGTRIGLSVVSFPVIFMITKNKKSPIFVLNMTCLGLLFLQSCLYAVTLTRTYNTISYRFSHSGEINYAASTLSVVSNLFYILLITFVEISFCYQVYIIFSSPQKNLKRLSYLATAFSAALGMASIALYFTFMVYSNLAFFDNNVSVPSYLSNTPLILFVTSSCAVCLLLLLKLAFAIRTRRYLGLKQFNLFHILFIMAFQTMVIPTILILISFNAFSDSDQYSSQTFSALGTALITISLPLTTMWANSSVSSSSPTSSYNVGSPGSFSSSDDNKTDIESPNSYYGKISDDIERSDSMYENENHSTVDNTMSLVSPATQNDREFWKEVELYTKDLGKANEKDGIEQRLLSEVQLESKS